MTCYHTTTRRSCCKDRSLRMLSLMMVNVFAVPWLVHGQVETSRIDDLITQWAPIIWLAPGEKFFPSSVEEFLENVYPADKDGIPAPFKRNMETEGLIPHGKDSERLFLHTKRNLDELNDESSFIYGKNPSKESVPIYVTVSSCATSSRTFSAAKFNEESNDIQSDLITEPDLHFHVSLWMFYPFNKGKEICVLGNIPTPIIFNTCFGRRKVLGNHIGDYEHLSISFKGKPHPDEMYLATHDTGVYYKYDPKKKIFKYKRQVTKKGIVQSPKFPLIVRTSNGRPILFAALGSHGLWSAPGEHYFVRVPRLSDENGYGTPWKTWNNLRITHLGFSRPPLWMKYQGRWGNPKSKCILAKKFGICEYSDGPQGFLGRIPDFYCSKR